MSILFYGDPHGQWQPLFEAVEKYRPDAAILLGDMDLDEPLRVKWPAALAQEYDFLGRCCRFGETALRHSGHP